METLRIGVDAPPWFAVPPTGYGGTELVVSNLVEGLVARGHDVTLFASGGSHTAARLVSPFERPPSESLGDGVLEAAHLLEAYAHAHQFDIIHDHTMLGLLTGATLPVPVVHTIHGDLNTRLFRFYQRLPRQVHVVAISHHQRSTLPPGLEATVIHNGIDPAVQPFSAQAGDYLLFVGRANPDKGPLEAIEIARRANLPLLMLCKVNELNEHEYFDRVLGPALRAAGSSVDLRMQVTVEDKMRAYAGAFATLFPIRWPEPFGLVMIESMAAGTPVIAFRDGAAPEVIGHGTTGFVVDSVDEAVEAVRLVPGVSRKACRESVEMQFAASLNVLRHEQLYRRILGADGEFAMGAEVRGRPATAAPGEEAATAS